MIIKSIKLNIYTAVFMEIFIYFKPDFDKTDCWRIHIGFVFHLRREKNAFIHFFNT